MKNIILLIALFAFVSCKPKNEQAQEIVNTPTLEYPPMPESEIRMLLENTTYVDYIFHELPFSVSQGEKGSIQTNILMISPDAPKLYSNNCKPIGREFFQKDGEFLYEADVFFDLTNKCIAYKFFKDGKAVYLNNMSKSGLTFYNNLINTDVKNIRK